MEIALAVYFGIGFSIISAYMIFCYVTNKSAFKDAFFDFFGALTFVSVVVGFTIFYPLIILGIMILYLMATESMRYR